MFSGTTTRRSAHNTRQPPRRADAPDFCSALSAKPLLSFPAQEMSAIPCSPDL
jgi:hypothetical protein